MVEVNYWAVLVCAVLSLVLGGLWYGPLFGKKWCEIVGANPDDMEARKKMQEGAGPLYFIQFLLSLFQVFVLAWFIGLLPDHTALDTSLWALAGFVLPTVAGAAMWNNDSKKVAWTRFFIQAGYQLVLFVLFALVIGNWR